MGMGWNIMGDEGWDGTKLCGQAAMEKIHRSEVGRDNNSWESGGTGTIYFTVWLSSTYVTVTSSRVVDTWGCMTSPSGQAQPELSGDSAVQ